MANGINTHTHTHTDIHTRICMHAHTGRRQSDALLRGGQPMFVHLSCNIFNNDQEDGVNSTLMKFAYDS